MKKFLLFIFLVFIDVIVHAQNIYTIAGNGSSSYNGDSIPALSASIGLLSGGVAIDSVGNVYIPDNDNHRIRKIEFTTGLISTVAGTGATGYNGDSIPADSASLYGPTVVALDRAGNIYIGDYANNRIRKVDVSTGLIHTVAGSGVWGYNGDSIPATTANLASVNGIALDTTGNIYISEISNNRIRKVDISTGLIHTVAGNGLAGYNGDSILADSAKLNHPHGIAVDESGNIFIADENNHRIRKVDASTGMIFTVAGNGSSGYNGDGILADSANLAYPWSVSVDKVGNLFIADAWNNRIRKVDTIGIISTVAGNGGSGSNGDGGPAVQAEVEEPRGVSVDDCGNVYISQYFDNVIRKVTSFNITVSTTNPACYGVCNGSLSASAAGGTIPYTYSWSGGLGSDSNQTNVCAGEYTLTVIDSDACAEYIPVTVSEPDSIRISIAVVNATCSNDGSAHTTSVIGGTPPYTYLWSNGSDSTSAHGLSAGNFNLTVTDMNLCTKTKSFSIINNPAPFPSAPICMVTVDSLSQYNVILWDKTSFTNVDSFIVYREISTNNYQPIANIPYSSLSLFTDTVRTRYFPNTGDPNVGTYRYKIQMRDTCGSYSTISPYHNTIFFMNNSGTFSWPQLYTIENLTNPVISYILLRDDNSNGNWHSIGSVAGTQQFITDPQYSLYQNTASWRVETQWNITCTPTVRLRANTTSYNSSLSNISGNFSTSVSDPSLENNLYVFPNPTDGKITVSSSILKMQHMEIMNILGEVIHSASVNEKQNIFQLDLSGFEKGIYFLNMKTSAGFSARKIVKE